MNNKNKKHNKKYLKLGSYSITMTAVLIAVVVILNLFVAEIPETYTKFDLSSRGLYTTSEESEKIIADVDEDVTFYLLAQRGNEDQIISELLERYAALNTKIKIENIDPVTNPAFISQYTDEDLTQNSVIAVSGKRSYAVDYYDIYVTEYTEEEIYYYYYYGVEPTGTPYFYGELMLSTALDYVTREEIPTLYSLAGHGESELSDAIESYITSENIARADLSLLAVDEIPEDCTSIIINNPTSDISAAECEMLKAYLDEGGGVILITNCVSYSESGMPNLAALSSHMGLESVDGIVVEGNRNNYMSDPRYLLPQIGTSGDGPLSLLSSTNFYVLMNAAHGIISDGTHDVTPLLSTTSSAYVKVDYTSSGIAKADDDIAGTVYIGASVTGEADGTRADEYKFVWYSSTAIVDETADTYTSGGNSTMFMASLSWMNENKVNLSVMAKQLQIEPLVVTEADAGIWSAIVVVVVPLAVILLGFAVWFKRRKR